MGRTSIEAGERAQYALERLVESTRDESRLFEFSNYDSPFVPQEDIGLINRIVDEYSAQVDAYLSTTRDFNAQHFCWMVAERGTSVAATLIQRLRVSIPPDFEGSALNTVASVRLGSSKPIDAIYDWVEATFAKGIVFPDLGPGGRLGLYPENKMCLYISYVVFTDSEVAERVRGAEADGDADFLQHCRNTDNTASPFLRYQCQELAATVEAVRNAVVAQLRLPPGSSERVTFHSHHFVVFNNEFAKKPLFPCDIDVFNCFSMQFQRRWGNHEKELQERNREQERRLQSALGILHNVRNLVFPALSQVVTSAQLDSLRKSPLLSTYREPGRVIRHNDYLRASQELLQELDDLERMLSASGVPPSYMSDSINALYSILRQKELSAEPRESDSMTAAQLTNTVIKALISLLQTDGLRAVPDTAGFVPSQLYLLSTLRRAFKPDVNWDECRHVIAFPSEGDFGRLVFTVECSAEARVSSAILVSHLMIELLWNASKHGIHTCLSRPTTEYQIVFALTEATDGIEFSYSQQPVDKDTQSLVTRGLLSPNQDTRGLLGAHYLADYLRYKCTPCPMDEMLMFRFSRR